MWQFIDTRANKDVFLSMNMFRQSVQYSFIDSDIIHFLYYVERLKVISGEYQ